MLVQVQCVLSWLFVSVYMSSTLFLLFAYANSCRSASVHLYVDALGEHMIETHPVTKDTLVENIYFQS